MAAVLAFSLQPSSERLQLAGQQFQVTMNRVIHTRMEEKVYAGSLTSERVFSL